ncbi:hypothetical protein [Sphingomonas sp.]|uniref:hypothetical protein n=1 Tax=Sphingomonas sp. TaxID=28214 RepID=UPI000BD10676|nr:hypothetical protein [Sphingomonas sp.]MBA4763228.1 hypothetical protein [Sphingomonas sp.]OYX17210.1 MAG: hypothetical protein B7Z07_00230 [Sphingomonadales bacterium 32-67-7]
MVTSAPRIREIIDATGIRLRVTLDAGAHGPSLRLGRPDLEAEVRLDVHGADLLCGYLIAARLAGRQQLPDETSYGPLAATFSLAHDPVVRIEVRRHLLDDAMLTIPATMWDRLYAELCIVGAHARALCGCTATSQAA